MRLTLSFRRSRFKSFGRAFSKARGFSGQSPESRSAERETFLPRFFLQSFFFARLTCKEKASNSYGKQYLEGNHTRGKVIIQRLI